MLRGSPQHRPARAASASSAIVPVVLALALGSVLSACSGDDDGGGPAAGGSPSAAAPLATRLHAGKIVGRLDPALRTSAVEAVGEVVDGWLDAAFTTGDYPRTDFADAFPGFTPGAVRSARQDLEELTSSSVAGSIDALTATRRSVAVDLLATGRTARTATARVRLDYTTSGDTAVDRTLVGRLFLTYGGGRWTVFGYDVAQGLSGPDAASEGASAPASTGSSTGVDDGASEGSAS